MADFSWKDAAGRSGESHDGYQFGDIVRIAFRGGKEVVQNTVEGTKEITQGITNRWKEEQYGIDSSADAGSSSASATAVAPAPANRGGAGSDKALLGERTALPGAASGGTAALGTVVKGAGMVWGAGKELVLGAGLGLAKGTVAAVDKAYEAAAPVLLTPKQQAEAQARMTIAARSVAAEMAPVLGVMATQFAAGALEGMDHAQQGMGKAYEMVVPQIMQVVLPLPHSTLPFRCLSPPPHLPLSVEVRTPPSLSTLATCSTISRCVSRSGSAR